MRKADVPNVAKQSKYDDGLGAGWEDRLRGQHFQTTCFPGNADVTAVAAVA